VPEGKRCFQDGGQAVGRVCVIGEILVEIMRPKAGVPLDRPGVFCGPYPSGAPAIFAGALARLGTPVSILGAVGADAFGRLAVERLRADGVDVSRVAVREDKVTAVAFVAYEESGERSFLFHLKDAAAACIPFAESGSGILRDADFLHICGSTLSLGEDAWHWCLDAARRVKNGGGRVLLDPNVRPELLAPEEVKRTFHPLLACCDYVLPSDGEAEALTGRADPEAAVEWLLGMGIQAVISKHGGRGSTVHTADGSLNVPAFAVDAVDPTGAGDCFAAGVVHGLRQDWDFERILTFANAAGALATRRLGPMEGAATLAEVGALIKQNGR
jgi:sugar/nucleoside kinase (ribokinase family)